MGAAFEARDVVSRIEMRAPLEIAELDFKRGLTRLDRHGKFHFQKLVALPPIHVAGKFQVLRSSREENLLLQLARAKAEVELDRRASGPSSRTRPPVASGITARVSR